MQRENVEVERRRHLAVLLLQAGAVLGFQGGNRHCRHRPGGKEPDSWRVQILAGAGGRERSARFGSQGKNRRLGEGKAEYLVRPLQRLGVYRGAESGGKGQGEFAAVRGVKAHQSSSYSTCDRGGERESVDF